MDISTMRCLIIAPCLVLASSVHAGDEADACPLLMAISQWLGANFGLAPADSPALALAPPETLVRMRYGPGANVAAVDVLAVYDQAGPTIYLADGWSGGTPAEMSVLVHEMVHHHQASAGMVFACPGAREELAYRAQMAWLGQFGESLESAFGIDSATLKVATACTH